MNSFPVHYSLVRRTDADGPYTAGQLWAEPDVRHAAHCLRSLIDDPALGREVGLRAAAAIREQLSPLAIGIRCRQRLSLVSWEHDDA